MSYTEEFRQEAVKLYRSGDKGMDKTARGLGIAPETLRKWIRREKEADQGLDITERERLRHAEKELKRLREENEILIISEALCQGGVSSLRRRQKRIGGNLPVHRARTRQPCSLHLVQGAEGKPAGVLLLAQTNSLGAQRARRGVEGQDLYHSRGIPADLRIATHIPKTEA